MPIADPEKNKLHKEHDFILRSVSLVEQETP